MNLPKIKVVDIKRPKKWFPLTRYIVQTPFVPVPTENEQELQNEIINEIEFGAAIKAYPRFKFFEIDKNLYRLRILKLNQELPKIIGGYEHLRRLIQYPKFAEKYNIEDTIMIACLVNKLGKIVAHEVLIGESYSIGFEQAVLNGLYKIRWQPAYQNNNPVKCWVTLTFNFELH